MALWPLGLLSKLLTDEIKKMYIFLDSLYMFYYILILSLVQSDPDGRSWSFMRFLFFMNHRILKGAQSRAKFWWSVVE